MKWSWWLWVIAGLFVLDAGLSAYQYYHLPLDGDLAPIVLPSEHYAETLKDPLAITTWSQGNSYAGAGRAFSHWWLKAYFDRVPLWLQSFMNPVASLYGAAALFRWTAHLAFLFLLVKIARPVDDSAAPSLTLLVGLGLCFPLLQIGGFHPQMGLIDQSLTYVAFYAWPMVGLLWWWAPFLKAGFSGKKVELSSFAILLRCLTALPIALSGPLIGPTHLIVLLVIGAYWRFQLRSWNSSYFLLLLFAVFAAYAYFVGQWNSETPAEVPSLINRYQEMLEGLWYQLSIRLGMPLLLLGVGANYWLSKQWLSKAEWQSVRRFYHGFIIFSLLYLILLPLGGWREYRASIIRVDTQLPITVGVFLLFVATTWRLLTITSAGVTATQLLKPSGGPRQRHYLIFVLLLLLIFQLADVNLQSKNACERTALERLHASRDQITQLPADCTVLAWDRMSRAEDARPAAELLLRLGVTDSMRLFQQE